MTVDRDRLSFYSYSHTLTLSHFRWVFVLQSHLICARSVRSRNRNIQQAEENAQLRPVVNGLRNSHTDYIFLGDRKEYLVSVSHCPAILKVFIGCFGQG